MSLAASVIFRWDGAYMKSSKLDTGRSESPADYPSAPPSERPDGDVMLDAAGVRTLFPLNAVTLWWVRRNVAPEDRIMLGRRVFWWRSDVNKWLDSRKQGRRG